MMGEEHMIKVSVVLPVYNPGNGIVKCIESLRNQTLRDIEMIFVDDRGTDDSMDAVRAAAAEDPRIRILVNPENMGAGPSRNRGIEAAKGKYLSFVDPDDYVAENFLELLYAKAEQTDADIIKGARRRVKQDGNVDLSPGIYLLNEQIRKGLDDGRSLYCIFTYEHWSAIYKRELVISYGAHYGTSKSDQDTTFLVQICYVTKTFELEDNAIYYNVYRAGSAVHDFSAKRIESIIVSFREQADFLVPKYTDSKEFLDHFSNMLRIRLNVLDTAENVFYMRDEASSLKLELREYLAKVPFIKELEEISLPAKALMEYNIILGTDLYGAQWREVSYAEYEGIARRWVAFLAAHSECCKDAKHMLRAIFENAIANMNLNDAEERRRAEENLRDIARGLPDRSVLTKDYVAMKLFVDYGINMFNLRNTQIGGIIKNVLSGIRKLVKRL